MNPTASRRDTHERGPLIVPVEVVIEVVDLPTENVTDVDLGDVHVLLKVVDFLSQRATPVGSVS